MDMDKEAIQKEIGRLTRDHLFDNKWLDSDTFVCEIKITPALRMLLTIIDNWDYEDDESEDDMCFIAEYWHDKKSFHYYLMFLYESVHIEKFVACEHLDGLILECAHIDKQR